MKRMVLLPFLCLVIPLVASGNDNEDEPVKAIQGEWNVVSVGSCGYELRGTAERPLTVIFRKDRIVHRPAVSFKQTASVSFGLGGARTDRGIEIAISERDLEGTFQIDPSKTPPWIDMKQRGKEVGSKGIYRLKKDELEMCIGKTFESKRPDEFKNSDSTWLFRLKRKEKTD